MTDEVRVRVRSDDDWDLQDTGYITKESADMIRGVAESKAQLEKIKAQLKENPSDPSVLAAYQAALSEYNLFRNAQSNMVKAIKDVGSSIITNFKN